MQKFDCNLLYITPKEKWNATSDMFAFQSHILKLHEIFWRNRNFGPTLFYNTLVY